MPPRDPPVQITTFVFKLTIIGSDMRRHPFLGTAVVVGASRSAARHKVEREEERSAQMQQQADREAAQGRYEEEERDRRTQLAIDEALAKERSKKEQQLAIDAAVAKERSFNEQAVRATPYAGRGQGVDGGTEKSSVIVQTVDTGANARPNSVVNADKSKLETTRKREIEQFGDSSQFPLLIFVGWKESTMGRLRNFLPASRC